MIRNELGLPIPEVQALTIDSGSVIAGAGDVFEWFGGGRRAAGVNVTPETAMRMSAVWRCVHPDRGRDDVHAARRLRAHPERRPEALEDHEYTLLAGRRAQRRHVLAGAHRDSRRWRPARAATATAAPPGPQRRRDRHRILSPRRVDAVLVGRPSGTASPISTAATEDHQEGYVLHFKGPGLSWDGLRAIADRSTTPRRWASASPRAIYRGPVRARPDDQRLFPVPGRPERHPGDQRPDFKEYLRKKAQGVANAHNPLLLENGAEWKRVAITAKDAQLLELLQYTADRRRRIFGVPAAHDRRDGQVDQLGHRHRAAEPRLHPLHVMPHLPAGSRRS
jgi:hypothetical protein